MGTLIFLNGKPRSGKDAAGEMITGIFGGTKVKMTEPIDAAFQSLFDLEDWQFMMLREELKETPLPIGDIDHGYSLRDFYIKFSEEFLKPLLGQGIFGHLASRRISELLADGNVVITDCGFNCEVEAIMNQIDIEGHNVWGVLIEREGTEWDSREVIDFGRFDIPFVTIDNDGSMQDLESQIIDICQECFCMHASSHWIARELGGGRWKFA